MLLLHPVIHLMVVSAGRTFIRSGSVRGEFINQSNGAIHLKATVIGGSPIPESFEWTLPNGRKLSPGSSSGSYQASPMSVS